MTVVSASSFNQAPSEIKAMSESEPVFITDRGRTTNVLLSIEEYERLTGRGTAMSLYDALRADDGIDFEPLKERSPGRVADLED